MQRSTDYTYFFICHHSTAFLEVRNLPRGVCESSMPFAFWFDASPCAKFDRVRSLKVGVGVCLVISG